MSKFDSEDKDMPGYFLPEDSQFRLKKLRDYTEFLSRLAQPRTWDETKEFVPEVRMGELAICLELLSEQAGLVLEDLSWPRQRQAKVDAEEVEEEEAFGHNPTSVMSPALSDAAAERHVFGVTLSQIDALNLLLDKLSAHGDVVVSSHEAEFADRTLPLIGQAIYDGVEDVRAILNEAQAQQIRPRKPLNRVGETRAVYGLGLVSPAARQGVEPGFRYGGNRTLQ
jgi:hypothetical protein